jgi:hypothetical protein
MNNSNVHISQSAMKAYIQNNPIKCTLGVGILACAAYYTIWGCPNSCFGVYKYNHRVVNGVCKPCK